MVRKLGWLAGMCAALVISQADGQQLTGWLSNFDAHNYLKEPVDNLELDFFGEIDTIHILKWYTGPNSWGNPPRITPFPAGTFPDLPGGLEVTWIDRINPIPHCSTRHFGLRLDPKLKRFGVQAYWTRIIKGPQIPVPWQFWVIEGGTIIDIIRLSETYPEPVYIRRWSAVVDNPVPLDRLNWELNDGVEWMLADPRPTPIEPGKEVDLPIKLPPGAGAVLVRYEVSNNDAMEPIITRFVNEAILGTDRNTRTQQITGTMSNFDVHNIYRGFFDNLELDLFGEIKPTDILDWYKGPNNWGNPPRIKAFPKGTFPNLPGGVEVTWLDRINPLGYCETRHFGLEIDPSVPPPGVQAYWTTIEKVEQIPVPWQFWEVFDDCRVRDIIVLSKTFDGGSVIIDREYALVSEVVELDELNWNLKANWKHVEGDPKTLRPGDSLVLDIQTSDEDKAVLVRYTTALVENPEMIVTRFVNEAIKEPCAPPERDCDLGDAPDPPYPSELANMGACHFNPPFPDHEHWEWLGDTDSFAVNQQCDPRNPQVDEEFNSHQIDRDSPYDYPGHDDGVVFHFPYEYCKEETVDVLVSTSGAGTSRYGQGRLYLNAWFDWDCNGNWAPPEHIVWKSATVIGPPGAGTAEPVDGTSTYTMNPAAWSTPCRFYRFIFHCDAKMDTISWARFRLSYQHNANLPTGSTDYGEVEDWKYKQEGPEGIEERGAVPPAFKLSKNLPDPFTTTTSIEYALPRETKVTLSIYNALGEKVKVLVDSEKQAGVYTVDWDGKNDEGERVPVGVYFYRLEADEYSQTMKTVILR